MRAQMVSIEAASQYRQELESKGVLSLVAALTDLWNMLCPEDKIELEVYPGHTEQDRIRCFEHNLRQLQGKYHQAKYMDTQSVANIKIMLIRYWWMAYRQAGVVQDDRDNGDYLTWNGFTRVLRMINAMGNFEPIPPPEEPSAEIKERFLRLLERCIREDRLERERRDKVDFYVAQVMPHAF